MMGSRHDEKRMNVEVDRLSSLPDDLIHKILSFISLQQAIETSALSSRWRYIWTSMPYLDFSSESFSNWKKFSKFVTKILSRRNNQVQLSSVKLKVQGKAAQALVKRILNYAYSHNVEQLTFVSSANKDDIPINLFSSQLLKHLTLTLSSYNVSWTLTSTWDLPALTTLCLTSIKLVDDFFSNCPNLENLTLYSCDTTIRLSEETEDSHLNICLPKLSNLTIINISCNVVNVEAPQLKNFIMREDYYYNVNFSADAVLSLEKVDLTIRYPHKAQTIYCMLQQFRGVKFLTLNLEIVECLSSSVELFSRQPSPFAKLKSLKIYPAREILHVKANVSTLVEKYFLDSSPGAALTMVLREGIRAHKLMEKLQKLLNRWKANSEKNTARVDQGEADYQRALKHKLMEKLQKLLNRRKENSDKNTARVDLGVAENQGAQQETIMESHFDERLTQIKSYWGELNKWYKEGDKRTRRIISMLRVIERLLKKLPASQRAKLQPMYTSLYAEADTFMDDMMDRVRIQCDKKPRRSNVHLHELATTSQPLS